MPGNLSFDDLPEVDKPKKGLAALSFDDLPNRPNAAAMNPEVNIGPFTVKGEADSGFNPAAMIIKAGHALDKINRGILQAREAPGNFVREKLGMPPAVGFSGEMARVEKETAQPMRDLQEVHPGSTLIGDIAPVIAAPWRMLPAIAASEYGSLGERAVKGGAALAGNALAVGGAKMANRALEQSRQKAAAAVAENAANAPFREAGLAAPPSMTNPTLTNRVMEGIAGGTKTEQALSAGNQPKFNRLIAEDLGLPPNTTITTKLLESIRQQEGRAYADLKLSKYFADDEFRQEVRGLRSQIAVEMPEMSNKAVDDLVAGLSKDEFSGATTVELVKRLRYKASVNYKNRIDPEKLELAQAQSGAAEALERLIERNLAAVGEEAKLAAFQAARTRIAKSWQAENALNDATGNIAARDYAGKKGLTGGSKVVGDFASKYPKSSQTIDSATKANPFSVVDALFSGGAAAVTGNPLLMSGVLARPAARGVITSPQYQRLMGVPSEKERGLLAARLLDNENAPFIAGLLGYGAAGR